MSISNVGSLMNYRNKIIGVYFSLVLLSLKVTTLFLNDFSIEANRYLNALTAFALFFIAFSKEKYDDERTQQIRYFTLKVTFTLSLAMLIAIAPEQSHNDLSFLPVFILLFYIAVFYITNYFNPKFIFEDRETSEGLSEGFAYIILGIGTIAFAYVIISQLIV